MRLFKSKWGKWTDILTGSYINHKFILQARRKKNRKIQMRVAKVHLYAVIQSPTMEQLNEIKYLYQLQNLYFALTNQELKIDL